MLGVMQMRLGTCHTAALLLGAPLGEGYPAPQHWRNNATNKHRLSRQKAIQHLDRHGDILRCHRFRRVVADPSRATHEEHCYLGERRHRYGVVPGTAR